MTVLLKLGDDFKLRHFRATALLDSHFFTVMLPRSDFGEFPNFFCLGHNFGWFS